MNNQKNWVDTVLNSLENVEKALPRKAFLNKLEKVAIAYVKPVNNISKPSILAIAASVLLLISINFSILYKYNNRTDANRVSQQLNDNYNLIPIKPLYNE